MIPSAASALLALMLVVCSALVSVPAQAELPAQSRGWSLQGEVVNTTFGSTGKVDMTIEYDASKRAWRAIGSYRDGLVGQFDIPGTFSPQCHKGFYCLEFRGILDLSAVQNVPPQTQSPQYIMSIALPVECCPQAEGSYHIHPFVLGTRKMRTQYGTLRLNFQNATTKTAPPLPLKRKTR